MVVGLLRLRLHIPAARSLKDRRAVVRRAVERVRSRFNVSIAEVGELDRWQVATLAVALATNDRSHANEVLDRVVSSVASSVAGQAELTARDMEITSYNDLTPLGQGLDLGPLPGHTTEDPDDGDDPQG